MWFPSGNYLVSDNKVHRTQWRKMDTFTKPGRRSTRSKLRKYTKTSKPNTESILHHQLLGILYGYKSLAMKNAAKFPDYTQIQTAAEEGGRRHLHENLGFLLTEKSFRLGWREIKLSLAKEVAARTAAAPEEPRDAFRRRRRVVGSGSFAGAGLQDRKEVVDCPLLKLCRPCSVVLRPVRCLAFAPPSRLC
ncbi:uncharacterized protein [Penaeus vannamei]|uniref:uncharacterized protein isoform X2 n=1 Tax=Penaeus vannamei TaxID=6689 RepID=UPI00387FAF79